MLDIDEALSRNMSANSHIQSILSARPARMDTPPAPRNPMVDTNSILERVEEDISRMARLAAMKAGSEQTERHAQRAFWVGGVGVVIGVLGIVIAAGTWLWTAHQQRKAENNRKADAKAASVERQADRELMWQQLEALQRSAAVLEMRLALPVPPVVVVEATQQKR